MKLSVSAACLLCFFAFASAHAGDIPGELAVLRQAYPEEITGIFRDSEKDDWYIRVRGGTEKTEVLYWAHGRLLPEAELGNADSYLPLFSYWYPGRTPDPGDFTDSVIEKLRYTGDDETRSSGPVMHPAFFSLIYDGATRGAVERNIVRVDFLGTRVTVHRKITEALARVERRIYALAERDSDVKEFVDTVSRIDGYIWREIRDTPDRSFHSFAVALDILPSGWGRKILYWQWVKAGGNEDWMLVPLSARWTPPDSVVSAFEAEGFIWGGKWDLWDNMHFEYRPELLLMQKQAGNR